VTVKEKPEGARFSDIGYSELFAHARGAARSCGVTLQFSFSLGTYKVGRIVLQLTFVLQKCFTNF